MQGHIVVITRNGSLGGRYPLTSTECLFGQSPNCDVRVYVANVALKHCLITALPNERAYIRNLSPSNTTLVNGIQIGATQYELQHADVITVGDRHFRWEYQYQTPSRQKTPSSARKTKGNNGNESPTCMVQVPMSVFEKKRHSSPGVLRENKIISITSQNGTKPKEKRRKTLHSVTDLVKPVNKQLTAVTQPANSPKSLKTFKVLLKSANKKKSSLKMEKPLKKVISTKAQRIKSLSPQKDSPKQESLSKYSQKSTSPGANKTASKKGFTITPLLQKSILKRKSVATMNLKSKTANQRKRSFSPSERKVSSESKLLVKTSGVQKKGSPSMSARKLHLLGKTLIYNYTKSTPESPSSKNTSVSLLDKTNSSPLDKTPGRKGRPSKTTQASPTRKSATPAASPSKRSQSSSPVDKTPGRRGRPSKTPQASPTRKSATPAASPSKLSQSSSPVEKTPGRRGRPSKTPQASPTRKFATPAVSPSKRSHSSSPVDKTPGRRGRPSKTPQASPIRKSATPAVSPSKRSQSSSPVDKTPGHRGRPSKTTQASPTRKSATPAASPSKRYQSSSPVEKTPGRRGKSSKTPQASSTRKSATPAASPSNRSQSSSPVDKTPGHRGRPSKTPQASPTRKSATPAASPSNRSQSSSPVDKTPGRRGRPSKTPQASPTRKSATPAVSPSKRSHSSSPVEKTPGRRGRFSKTPLASPTRKSATPAASPSKRSQSSSPVDKTPGRRGRPSKTPQASPTRKSATPAASPSKLSQSSSPVDKTPGRRGRPSKTPQASPTRKFATPAASPSKRSQSSSPVDKTPGRRGRPSKTPQASPTRKSATPAASPSKRSQSSSPVVKTPGRRGRPSKTPQASPTRKSATPAASPLKLSQSSSAVDNTPGHRGRPSKTPQVSPTRKSATPAASPLKLSQSSSPVDKTPGHRGRPSKTPQASSTRKSATPGALLSKLSQSSSPVDKTPKDTSPETSTISHASSNKYFKDNQDTSVDKKTDRTSRGRPSTTPVMFIPKSGKKLSFVIGNAKMEKESESEILPPHLFQPTFPSNLNVVSDKTKSARRSALKSGLSSSKRSSTSLNKPLLMNSSAKKVEIAKLQSDSKRKYDTDAEAKAERAAKRLKMETPKSLTKNKKAALLVCHSPKSQKRPLFSEVLKSHLSTVKKNQAASTAHAVVARRAVKGIAYKPPLSLEVPPSFNFNSTGHANSPETIIIRKKIKGTPIPIKTRKGRKSTLYLETKNIEDKNLEGVPELFQTPKAIVSSLKSASSVKKPQNVRVRFSLQNDVQSPSGRKSLVQAEKDEVPYFGSPMIPPKKYISTPRPSMKKFSNNSLMHSSIMEESLLAEEIDTFGIQSSPLRTSDKISDFSAYSPSSPTLQFSRISGVSTFAAKKSIDFIESPSFESDKESPKRKRSLRTPNDSSISVKLTTPNSSSSFNNNSVRSTRSGNFMSDSATEKHSPKCSFSTSDENVIMTRLPKRISSTPKGKDDSTNTYSPITSPISVHDKTSSEGKKSRKRSTRMNASNTDILTPESQVPVAAVKPSTRRKQVNESYSSLSESISLPAFSVSHEISDRSVNRSLAHKILDSRASSSLEQPSTSRNTTSSEDLSFGSINSSRRKRKSSSSTSIQSVDATTFDFTSAMTPKIPREMFVSPLGKVSDDLIDVSGVQRILSPKGKSPVSSYEDVKGLKKLFKTSKLESGLTNVMGVKRVMNPNANSPISSYIDVRGVKRLMKIPKTHSPLTNYSSVKGIKELFKHSPVADYTNVAGVKNLYTTSVEPNYINVRGVRRIFKEAPNCNSPDIAGLEVLFESPKKLMDEFNQTPSSKPVGMVTPMSRPNSGLKASKETSEITNDRIEENQVMTRNTENMSQTSSRRKTNVTQQTTGCQPKPNTSVSLRKGGKRSVGDSLIVTKAANQSQGAGIQKTKEQIVSIEEEDEKVKSSRKVKINSSNANEELLMTSKRKCRGRAPSPVVKDIRRTRIPRELDSDKEANINASDIAQEQVSANSKINIKESTRVQQVSELTNSNSPKPKPRRTKVKSENCDTINIQQSVDLPSTSFRKRKTDSSSSSISTERTSNSGREDAKNRKFDEILSEPTISKKTRRKVQFNINSSPSPKQSIPKEKAARRTPRSKSSDLSPVVNIASPTVDDSKLKKKVLAKTVTLKTKSSPKLKASTQESLPSPIKSNARSRATRGKKAKSPSPTRVARAKKAKSPSPTRVARGNEAKSPSPTRVARRKEAKSPSPTTRVARGKKAKSPSSTRVARGKKAKSPSPTRVAKESLSPPKKINKRPRVAKHATKAQSPSPARGAKRATKAQPPSPTKGAKRATKAQPSSPTREAKRATKAQSPSPTTGAKRATKAHSPSSTRGAKRATKAQSPSPTRVTKDTLPSPNTSKPRSRAAKGKRKVESPSPVRVAKESSPPPKGSNLRKRAARGSAKATSPSTTKVAKIESPTSKDGKSKKKAPAKTLKTKTKPSPKVEASTQKKSSSPIRRVLRTRK